MREVIVSSEAGKPFRTARCHILPANELAPCRAKPSNALLYTPAASSWAASNAHPTSVIGHRLQGATHAELPQRTGVQRREASR